LILIFCPGGGIGRHARLRGVWRKPCGFKSRPGHFYGEYLFFCPNAGTDWRSIRFLAKAIRVQVPPRAFLSLSGVLMNVYGPVFSRRLGYSLGVDLFSEKSCSQNCVYCQLGSFPPISIQRKSFINPQHIKNELADKLATIQQPDFISFVGSGEPTLSSDLPELIEFIKDNYPNIKISVITNGNLLYLKEVRDELQKVHLVIPSLDAGSQETFTKMNRPNPEMTFERHIEGLLKFREEYKGQYRLEVMLVKNINDSVDELEKIAFYVEQIQPDVVDINVPCRPPAEKWVEIPNNETLKLAESILQGKIISTRNLDNKLSGDNSELFTRIIDIIKRRPETIKGISSGLMQDEPSIREHLERLVQDGFVEKYLFNGKEYFGIA
jgi:wyosine [tRNA(Phe)-imidazoG37] synthetase (radical SAM superfamily)